MTHPAIHGEFTLERHYEASPEQVFEAWGDIEAKKIWFVGPGGWKVGQRTLEFRVGGEEILTGELPGKFKSEFVARYYEILENERIVYVYDMHVNGPHHSVSLATVEMTPERGGTRLTFMEQVTFLDGTDGTLARERGTGGHLDRLGELLTKARSDIS